MLDFVPGFIKGPIAAVIFVSNTVFWCVLLYLVALVKLLPIPRLQAPCAKLMIQIAELWITCNSQAISLIHKVKWNIHLPTNLSLNRSYLVVANHQSWVDIVALQHVFNHKIPFIRFFLKDQLRYVPFLGAAWKALDFPFMKRYTRAYLEKHPEKRGEDLKETKRACGMLRGRPVSILNFLEGTRFTESKHRSQKSIYKNLLSPKTGGIAYVIEAMGAQFDSILNVTVFYPEGAESLWGLFSGRLNEITVWVERMEIPEDLLGGGYFDNEQMRERMQAWITDLWTAKDQQLTSWRPHA